MSRQSTRAFNPQRVLMVTSALAVGGCERQMLATAEGLVARGYELQIFELADVSPQFGFESEFWNLGIQSLHACDFYDDILREADERSDHALASFAALLPHVDIVQLGKALRQNIAQFQPDIVHCWADPANVIGGLVADEMSVPRIVLSHRNVPPSREDFSHSALYREAHRHLMRQPNVVSLSNSESNRLEYETWLDAPHGAINLVNNGFSPRSIHIRGRHERAMCRRALWFNEDAVVVGAIMRFAAEKEPMLWLDTAAAIAKQRPDVRFLLAGYGDLADDVARKVSALELADRVMLPGPTLDVGVLYGAMDVFLLTSRREGMPNVLIEAQAAGVPIVSPRVGGTAETVSHGKTGLIVEERSVTALAAGVLTILAEPQWRQSASVYGPAVVADRFSQSRMVDETIKLYGCPTRSQSAVNGPASRGAMPLRRALAERIRQLEAMVAQERCDRVALERTLTAERKAATVRIGELNEKLEAEHHAFVARINELVATLSAERMVFASRIGECETTLSAERQAFVTRIHELETVLSAERAAYIRRINELKIGYDTVHGILPRLQ